MTHPLTSLRVAASLIALAGLFASSVSCSAKDGAAIADALADDGGASTAPAGGAAPEGSAAPMPSGTPEGETPGPAAATGLPCNVQALLQQKCGSCHGAAPAFGASAPLVTHENLVATWGNGKKVHDLVVARAKDDARPMPPVPNPRLKAPEVAILEEWVKAGAPRSDERCTDATPPQPDVKPLSCTPNLTIKASKPFVMAPGSPIDQYSCFGFTKNSAQKEHVTAFAPRIDNKKILHHILLFQTDQPVSSEPHACDANASAGWRLVAGWAPGGPNVELPPEAGFPQNQGATHWVMQLHYNNAQNTPGQTDNSGYDLCTTTQLRQHDAGILAFGTTNIDIPPRAKRTMTCNYTLGQEFQGVKFFNTSPHMHTFGRLLQTDRLPGGNGAPEKILNEANFNFENQSAYPTNNAVAPRDVIRTRCGFDNTSDARVRFGEGTGDEMCFNFVGYYPKIPDRTVFGLPVFTWITPSLQARCTVQ
jgi:mono/diheme cytochrome c family protein